MNTAKKLILFNIVAKLPQQSLKTGTSFVPGSIAQYEVKHDDVSHLLLQNQVKSLRGGNMHPDDLQSREIADYSDQSKSDRVHSSPKVAIPLVVKPRTVRFQPIILTEGLSASEMMLHDRDRF